MTPEGGPSLPTQVVADAVATAGMDDEQAQARLKEEGEVRAFFKQFDADQKFDKPIREQIDKDRAYASGQAVAGYAVSTNMTGAAIDTQTATLYARDPDVSCKPAPQVDPPPDPTTGMVPPQPERQRRVDLAKSLELVLSALWKKGKLKPRMRRVVRGILSTSHAWLKVLPVTNRRPDPLAQNEYNTLQQNIADVAAQMTALQAGQTLDGNTASVEDLEVQKKQLELSQTALASRLEVEVCYGFTFDVVKPENLQVGTDVELLEEYMDSDSLTETMYFPHDQLRSMFPELTAEDLQAADKYYRKKPINQNRGESGSMQAQIGAAIAAQYPNQGNNTEMYTTTAQEEGATPFAKVLEKWNKPDNHIYTAICGVKVWARKPYQPSWATSRFYPYFYFSLTEVDGQRCPQSQASRGAKLEDEYACVRSNLRITRERCIPATLADAGAFSDTELDKMKVGQIAEIIAMKPTMPGQDFTKAFAAKPTPNIDMRLYDPQPILFDFERVWRLSDTQQQSKSIETTATEEEIKAASANVGNNTWRDMIETTLTDVAVYCAELAWQKIPPDIAQKIAGPAVLWPVGLSLEDITSLVEVSIAAGTTGKPRQSGDREAWATILPTLQAAVEKIWQYKQNPATLPLAIALEEQVRETMRRFGDESDLSRFIPQMPSVELMAAAAAGQGMPPGAPGAPPPGDPGAPPDGGLPLGEVPEGPDAVDPMAAGMAANGFVGTP